jgi:hypothetical protein
MPGHGSQRFVQSSQNVLTHDRLVPAAQTLHAPRVHWQVAVQVSLSLPESPNDPEQATVRVVFAAHTP